MNACDPYREARRRGLRLEPRGDKLAVIPADLCPVDFADALRRHKGELLALLECNAANLPPDYAPRLHVAKQVLTGEFDGADKATAENVAIGLRATNHVLCRQALARLRGARNAA